jgi:hypothetical protein
MQCPKCKLESPPEAERCDCGYDFKLGTMKASYLTPKQRQAARIGASGTAAIVILYLVLKIIQAVLASRS